MSLVSRALAEYKALFLLGMPIFISQVSSMLLGTVDSVMAGRLGAEHLSAIAIGQSLWLPVTLLCFGVFMALPAMVAKQMGAAKPHLVKKTLHQSLWLALFVSVAGAVLIQWLLRVAVSPSIESVVYRLLVDYLSYLSWGLPALGLFTVLRSVSEGLDETTPSMWIAIAAVLLNIPANYAFIFGHWGAPALGAAGCGVASSLIYWLMLLAMALQMFYRKVYRPFGLFKTLYKPALPRLHYIARIGFPMGLAFFFEVCLFALVALFLAPLGAQTVAAHQIALNISSLPFMLPLSLSIALSIRMGFCLGQADHSAALFVFKATAWLGAFLVVIIVSSTIGLRYWLAAFYSQDRHVIELAASLLLIAGIYQASDMAQVLCAGALRAYHDGKGIFIRTFIAYWAVGFPLGYALALTDTILPAMGAAGFWWGFVAGLSLAAVLLSIRLRGWFRGH